MRIPSKARLVREANPAPDTARVYAPEHVRPSSASIISVLAWGLCAYLLADAVWARGIHALWLYGPGLGLAATLVWMILWAPRLVIYPDRAEIRNIVLTHSAPYGAIEAVSIGAMVRLSARVPQGGTRTITAWNAPGIGRDTPADATLRVRPRSHAKPRPGPAERLSADQRRSASWILYQKWDTYLARHGELSAEVMSTRINRVPLGVLAVVILLNLARLVV